MGGSAHNMLLFFKYTTFKKYPLSHLKECCSEVNRETEFANHNIICSEIVGLLTAALPTSPKPSGVTPPPFYYARRFLAQEPGPGAAGRVASAGIRQMHGGGWEWSHRSELRFGCQLGSSVSSARIWEDQVCVHTSDVWDGNAGTARAGWA